MLNYRAFLTSPSKTLNALAARILRISLFVTAAIGSAWGSICLFATYLPRHTLATQRWFLGGFVAGLWAFVARRGERANFLYSARLSVDCLWKVGVKRGWWRKGRGGDVLVFVASLALVGSVYEGVPGAVRGGAVRKAVGVLRGEGWVDRAATVGGVEDGQEDAGEGMDLGDLGRERERESGKEGEQERE